MVDATVIRPAERCSLRQRPSAAAVLGNSQPAPAVAQWIRGRQERAHDGAAALLRVLWQWRQLAAQPDLRSAAVPHSLSRPQVILSVSASHLWSFKKWFKKWIVSDGCVYIWRADWLTLPYLTFGVGRLLHLPSAEAISVRPNAQPRCNQRSQ